MPNEPSIPALAAAVMLASLIGSMHCAGMCGGLVLFAIGADGTPVKRLPLHLAYHLGRGLSYTALGAVAGTLGLAFDWSAAAAGWQRPAAAVAGAAMVAFGIMGLAHAAGWRGSRVALPTSWTRFIERGHRAAFALRPVHRAAAVGLLTPLLPCGWLYAFVIVAAGAASPVVAALIMLVFWIGTLPVMTSVGAGAAMLSGALRAKLPLVTCVLVIIVGLWTALGRVAMPTLRFDTPGPLATTSDAFARVQHLRDTPPACPLCEPSTTSQTREAAP